MCRRAAKPWPLKETFSDRMWDKTRRNQTKTDIQRHVAACIFILKGIKIFRYNVNTSQHFVCHCAVLLILLCSFFLRFLLKFSFPVLHFYNFYFQFSISSLYLYFVLADSMWFCLFFSVLLFPSWVLAYTL